MCIWHVESGLKQEAQRATWSNLLSMIFVQYSHLLQAEVLQVLL